MGKSILALAMLVLTAGFSEAADWQVLMAKSRISFSGTQAGIGFEGEFLSYSADINFDPEKLNVSKVRIVIDMKSAVTGNDDRDTMLLGPDWFGTDTYPEGIFEVQAFRHIEGEKYEADAVLTIRDKTKAITLPFALAVMNDRARMTGQLTLDRRAFGIGRGPQWENDRWVAYPVDVTVEITAARTE